MNRRENVIGCDKNNVVETSGLTLIIDESKIGRNDFQLLAIKLNVGYFYFTQFR